MSMSIYKDEDLKPVGDGIEAMYRHIIKEDATEDPLKKPDELHGEIYDHT